jgi:hypothetical protein
MFASQRLRRRHKVAGDHDCDFATHLQAAVVSGSSERQPHRLFVLAAPGERVTPGQRQKSFIGFIRSVGPKARSDLIGERTDVEDRLRWADMFGETGLRLATIDMTRSDLLASEPGRVQVNEAGVIGHEVALGRGEGGEGERAVARAGYPRLVDEPLPLNPRRRPIADREAPAPSSISSFSNCGAKVPQFSSRPRKAIRRRASTPAKAT